MVWIALIFLAVAMSVAGVKGFELGGAAKEKELAPQIASLTKQAADEKAANAGFYVNEAGYKEQIRACNQRADSAIEDSKIATAMQAKLELDMRARASRYDGIIARFRRDAANPALPPDKQCEAMKKIVVEATDEMKALNALGLSSVSVRITRLPDKVAPTPKADTPTVPPKSAIKTLPRPK